MPQPPPRCLTTISTSLVASTNLAAVRRSCCPRFPSSSLRPLGCVPWQDQKGLASLPVDRRLLLGLSVLSCQSPRKTREKLSDCLPFQRRSREAQTRLSARGAVGPGGGGGGKNQGLAKWKGKQEAQAQGPGPQIPGTLTAALALTPHSHYLHPQPPPRPGPTSPSKQRGRPRPPPPAGGPGEGRGHILRSSTRESGVRARHGLPASPGGT